jgi:hypothetical protein
MTLLERLFGAPEEMNGVGRCPTYLYRWTLLKWRGRGVYLHHFVGDDWSLDLHDHPKRFISIGLKGGYREERLASHGITFEVFEAPWIRTFPAVHSHRLTMIDGGDCWTLVIVLKATRSWGFWHEGKFIGWRSYVNSETADQMKSCD